MLQIPKRQFDAPYADIFLMPIFFKEPILWTNFFKIIDINFYIAFTVVYPIFIIVFVIKTEKFSEYSK